MNCPFCDSKGIAQEAAESKAERVNHPLKDTIQGAISQISVDDGGSEIKLLMLDICPACRVMFLSGTVKVKKTSLILPISPGPDGKGRNALRT